MAGRKRRGNHGGGGHASGERWLITYADLITLLLVFFVVMYAMSQVDKKKYEEVAKSLAKQFSPISTGGGGTDLLNHPAPIENPAMVEPIMPPEQLELKQLSEEIERLSDEAGLAGEIETRVEQRGLVVSISNSAFFGAGDATLRREVMPTLAKVALALKGTQNPVRIEGHTDNTPIHTARFPSNWELSAGRATSIVRFLIERHGFPPTRLSAAGYGEYYPKVPNDSERNRALNRRVDIVVLRSALAAQEPSSGGDSN